VFSAAAPGALRGHTSQTGEALVWVARKWRGAHVGALADQSAMRVPAPGLDLGDPDTGVRRDAEWVPRDEPEGASVVGL
jgi:hypothetical protein